MENSKVDPALKSAKYALSHNSLIYDHAAGRASLLDKYVEHHGAKLGYGSEPLAVAGALPKGPVKMTSDLVFQCVDVFLAEALRDFDGMTKLLVLWI